MRRTGPSSALIPGVALALGLLAAIAPLGGAAATARPHLTVRPATVNARSDSSGRFRASRAPTKSEAAAIRKAALRSLHGSGWKVSAIRVSTVPTKHRYAKAAVDNRATGVGGEMILWRDAGRWRRIFLGTDGFCDANAPKRVLRDLGFGC